MEVLLVAFKSLQLASDALKERTSFLDDGAHGAISLLSALSQARCRHSVVLLNGNVMLVDVALSSRDVSLNLLLDGCHVALHSVEAG